MVVEMTVKEVAERLGIYEVKIVKEKEKYQFKSGDIVTAPGSGPGRRRIVMLVNGTLRILDSWGCIFGDEDIQEYAERHDYKKAGELNDAFRGFIS